VGAVDDGGAIPRGGASERLDERGVHAPISLAPTSTSIARSDRFGPGKASDELRRVGGQPEARQDLVAHDGGGGGRAGEHPRAGRAPRGARRSRGIPAGSHAPTR